MYDRHQIPTALTALTRLFIRFMIRKQPFGSTGHNSTVTIFGAAALGKLDQDEADRTLDVLLQYGVNHIDTTASYGAAELRLGPWMKRHRA